MNTAMSKRRERGEKASRREGSSENRRAGKGGEGGCLLISQQTRRLVMRFLAEQGSENTLNSKVGQISWRLETTWCRVKKQMFSTR